MIDQFILFLFSFFVSFQTFSLYSADLHLTIYKKCSLNDCLRLNRLCLFRLRPSLYFLSVRSTIANLSLFTTCSSSIFYAIVLHLASLLHLLSCFCECFHSRKSQPSLRFLLPTALSFSSLFLWLLSEFLLQPLCWLVLQPHEHTCQLILLLWCQIQACRTIKIVFFFHSMFALKNLDGS